MRLLFLALVLAGCATAQPNEPDSLFEQMTARVEAREDDLVALRHDLHRHPELSKQESRTAGVVAARLDALGFEVRTGVGGHGVVGLLRGARPGPLVAFRADMDAVTSDAPDPVDYRSTVPGVRHICGHDVHTTIGIGLAEGFASIADELEGSVLLLFQPAEERGTGANAMLADGVFEDATPDAIFAVHTAPFEVGTVATTAGGMMAGRARFGVTLSGTGDLAEAASRVRDALEGIATIPPDQIALPAPRGFVFVQLFRGDETSSGQRTVRGQIMTAGPEDRARAKTEALAALETVDLPTGVEMEVTYDEHFMEGVTNDEALVALANAAAEAHLPDLQVQPLTVAVPMFSEDFGSFQTRTPGVMYFLGVSNAEAGTVGMPHTPDYVADDGAILVGTRLMAAAMLARLRAE